MTQGNREPVRGRDSPEQVASLQAALLPAQGSLLTEPQNAVHKAQGSPGMAKANPDATWSLQGPGHGPGALGSWEQGREAPRAMVPPPGASNTAPRAHTGQQRLCLSYSESGGEGKPGGDPCSQLSGHALQSLTSGRAV